eukprot:TRINITY_DN45941_c0_g1_i1.p1 TRINITY_DN45941_c0_g1~~TRINITY_DN45941_c0_g1_i1.p1  ORF type:complete len:642 (-),score=232.78 TRINITY_DN45941_c0_g1_i1:153-2003(-)
MAAGAATTAAAQEAGHGGDDDVWEEAIYTDDANKAKVDEEEALERQSGDGSDPELADAEAVEVVGVGGKKVGADGEEDDTYAEDDVEKDEEEEEGEDCDDVEDAQELDDEDDVPCEPELPGDEDDVEDPRDHGAEEAEEEEYFEDEEEEYEEEEEELPEEELPEEEKCAGQDSEEDEWMEFEGNAAASAAGSAAVRRAGSDDDGSAARRWVAHRRTPAAVAETAEVRAEATPTQSRPAERSAPGAANGAVKGVRWTPALGSADGEASSAAAAASSAAAAPVRRRGGGVDLAEVEDDAVAAEPDGDDWAPLPAASGRGGANGSSSAGRSAPRAADLARLQAENRALRIELGQERFKVQQLSGLREQMANAQRKELQAKRAEADAQAQLRDAKSYVARRVDFETSERADLLHQIASLEKLVKEMSDREESMQRELAEALSEKANASLHIGEAKKETELWRKESQQLQVKLKGTEQRVEQLERRVSADKAAEKAAKLAEKELKLQRKQADAAGASASVVAAPPAAAKRAGAPREPDEALSLAWCPWRRQPVRQGGRPAGAGATRRTGGARKGKSGDPDDMDVVVRTLDRASANRRERTILAALAVFIVALAAAKASIIA